MDTLDLTDERLKRILNAAREMEGRRVTGVSSSGSSNSGVVDFSSLAQSGQQNNSGGAMPDFLSALAGANNSSNSSSGGSSFFNSENSVSSSALSNSGDDGTKRILDRLGSRVQELDEQLIRISERLVRLEADLQGRYS